MEALIATLLICIVALVIVLLGVLRRQPEATVALDRSVIDLLKSELESKVREVASDVILKSGRQLREEGKGAFDQQRDTMKLEAERLLQPFEEQMSELGRQVEELNRQNDRNKTSVDDAVKNLSDQTAALAKVLANPRERGNWGERMLEDVLNRAGLTIGLNYAKQETQKSGLTPDYTFFLPLGQVVYLDSKFPADNYLKYFQAPDELQRVACVERFNANLQTHLTGLAKKNYPANGDRPSVDYTLAFIPNESVMGFIQQHNPTAIDDALKSKILLCSPLTLYAFLAVVRQASESFNMQEKATEILELNGRVRLAWEHYHTRLEEVWEQFEKLRDVIRMLTVGKVMQNFAAPLRDVEALIKKSGIQVSDETLKSVEAEIFTMDEGIRSVDHDQDNDSPS
jgi:DNA recombination protein RmuC